MTASVIRPTAPAIHACKPALVGKIAGQRTAAPTKQEAERDEGVGDMQYKDETIGERPIAGPAQ